MLCRVQRPVVVEEAAEEGEEGLMGEGGGRGRRKPLFAAVKQDLMFSDKVEKLKRALEEGKTKDSLRGGTGGGEDPRGEAYTAVV